ncbi:hypothetical protein [Streptomyces sp. NBC_00347]|uniref:hypothetical protein n=1 Tax=Streptomyces sp. NBC_00347 TaxID=2975721 RepID=UPI002B1E68A1|nr:hypothetical protein [Streptomyces sp. NBC_00347]
MARLEEVVVRAYAVGALSASQAGAGLYRARGWSVWPGRIGVLGPERLPEEEGATYVWAPPGGGVLLDPTAGPLYFDWRDGDVL